MPGSRFRSPAPPSRWGKARPNSIASATGLSKLRYDKYLLFLALIDDLVVGFNHVLLRSLFSRLRLAITFRSLRGSAAAGVERCTRRLVACVQFIQRGLDAILVAGANRLLAALDR